MLSDERQDSALTLDGGAVCIRDDVDAVDRPADQSIGRSEHVDGTYKVEFVHGRYGNNDQAALQRGTPRTGLL
jgi:hypothetical protein